MKDIKQLKPLALALGTTFVASLAGTGLANAADNPFGMSQLSSGYMVAEMEGKCGEGKCGAMKSDKAEAKCGAMKSGKHEAMCGMNMLDANSDGKIDRDEFVNGHAQMFDRMDKDGNGILEGDETRRMKMMEGKCGAGMKDKMEGKCGGSMKKDMEGKCGEGKCGGNK